MEHETFECSFKKAFEKEDGQINRRTNMEHETFECSFKSI